MDLLGVARRLSSLSFPATSEITRQQVSRRRFFQFQQNLPLPPGNTMVQPAFQGSRRLPVTEITRLETSRQRYFAPPPVSPAAPGPGGVWFGGPAFEANRRYPVHYLRQARDRARFSLPGLQPPILPGNQVTTPALGITRRIGAASFLRRVSVRARLFSQPLAAPVVPGPGGAYFTRQAFSSNRRFPSAYHRVLRDRTRVFISGAGILQGTSPLLSGTGTLTAAVTMQVNAAVALSGVGSMQVVVGDVAKYTALSYIPADSSLVLAGHSLTEAFECQVGNDSNMPVGLTDFGFVDTTYSPSKVQILATASTSVL